jgi:hypothetical protein
MRMAPRLGFPIFLLAVSLALGGASAARAEAMSFRLVPLSDPAHCHSDKKCVAVITAQGEIVDATPDAFVRFLASHVQDPRLRTVVFFNSPGGKVVASMKLGRILRKIGAMTVVAQVVAPPDGSKLNAAFGAARCYSACVYALMGGKKRIAPPQSLIGIHRMFNIIYEHGGPGESGPEKVYDAGMLGRQLEAYAGQMGVSPDLVATAETISSDKIHILTRQELTRWRLATQKF